MYIIITLSPSALSASREIEGGGGTVVHIHDLNSERLYHSLESQVHTVINTHLGIKQPSKHHEYTAYMLVLLKYESCSFLTG